MWEYIYRQQHGNQIIVLRVGRFLFGYLTNIVEECNSAVVCASSHIALFCLKQNAIRFVTPLGKNVEETSAICNFRTIFSLLNESFIFFVIFVSGMLRSFFPSSFNCKNKRNEFWRKWRNSYACWNKWSNSMLMHCPSKRSH